MTQQELVDRLGLRLIPGVGSLTYLRLVAAMGSAGAALGAGLEALRAVPGVREEVARAVHQRRFAHDPERQLARLERLGGRLVCPDDPEYPPPLRTIFAPPALLFVRGDLSPLAAGGVAVVGSRGMSAYGRQVAGDLGAGLGRAGVSLVSGLARGVDGTAQEAALKAGGHTAGVLGCGLDVAYPPEHADLMNRVAAQGALISEYPLGMAPLAGNFPARNRIISGLARAVVVVEAGLKSGSLITARHALDQGREVLAVPGPVTSPGSQGCHQLLKQGARVYTGLEDLLTPGSLPPMVAEAEPFAPPDIADLPPEAAKLLELIPPAGMHIDQLARAAGLKTQEVSALMVNLELAELVQEKPGKIFLRL